ncbi:hypothetical protein M9H77_34303 [Catharanthus roseus]|uniref:Uncharacterized protein n=1 Tax=Catharanthus roseus TaxID=4058 RepID=A0ACB9ZLI1_CATRO|nr:hypothetical protein M9H77_34303 [Catharanthus roseus]
MSLIIPIKPYKCISSPEMIMSKADNGRSNNPPSLPSGFKPAPEGPKPLFTPPSMPPPLLGVVTRGEVPVGELIVGLPVLPPVLVVGVAVVVPGMVVVAPPLLQQ